EDAGRGDAVRLRARADDPAASGLYAEHPRRLAQHPRRRRVPRSLSGRDRVSLLDLADLADAAAVVLMNDGHAGATYELAGTRPLSQAEVAAAIGAALGRDVRAEAETVDAWEARARAAGAGEHERSTLAAMFRYYAQHGLAGN